MYPVSREVGYVSSVRKQKKKNKQKSIYHICVDMDVFFQATITSLVLVKLRS